MVETGKRLSEVVHVFDPAPQKLVNRKFQGAEPLICVMALVETDDLVNEAVGGVFVALDRWFSTSACSLSTFVSIDRTATSDGLATSYIQLARIRR